MPGSLRIWKADFIVFVASVCSLVIELVAGRILAPYIGVSLYTWTSIIGVVLAGISIGNYIGGKIADRWASPRTLGVQFFASGIFSLAILPLTAAVAGGAFGRDGLPLVARIVVYTLLIFFPPSCLLGTISPVVVKLTLKNLDRTGNVVGQIYAVSTVGAILGTFLTGFVLISTFGTREIVWMVAGILLAVGFVFGEFWRSMKTALPSALLFIAVALVSLNRPSEWSAPCIRETNYYCIRFDDTTMDGKDVRALVLDHLIHSYSSVTDPLYVGYGYERIYVELTNYYVKSRNRDDLGVMFIGGGGYTFPRYIETKYPRSSVEVVEIDPAVTEESFKWMGLDPNSQIVTHNEDARQFVIRESAGHRRQFDLIYGDAFNDLSVPYHLTTKEFHDQLKTLLRPDGIYMVNVIDNLKYGEFVQAYLKTLQQTFANVYLLGLGSAWENGGTSTYVLVASDRPIDQDEYRRYALAEGQTFLRGSFMPEDRLKAYVAQGRFLLTDSFAPVDNLVARLFVERGF